MHGVQAWRTHRTYSMIILVGLPLICCRSSSELTSHCDVQARQRSIESPKTPTNANHSTQSNPTNHTRGHPRTDLDVPRGGAALAIHAALRRLRLLLQRRQVLQLGALLPLARLVLEARYLRHTQWGLELSHGFGGWVRIRTRTDLADVGPALLGDHLVDALPVQPQGAELLSSGKKRQEVRPHSPPLQPPKLPQHQPTQRNKQ